MNQPDLNPAAGIPASKPPSIVCPQSTRHDPLRWQGRPTDPLRVTIVTAFCTCDVGQPQPSYMPRLPR